MDRRTFVGGAIATAALAAAPTAAQVAEAMAPLTPDGGFTIPPEFQAAIRQMLEAGIPAPHYIVIKGEPTLLVIGEKAGHLQGHFPARNPVSR